MTIYRYIDDGGVERLSIYPTTRKSAISKRSIVYLHVGGYCMGCQTYNPLRHVKDDGCFHCLQLTYNNTLRTVPPDLRGVCRFGSHYREEDRNGTCVECGDMSPRQRALVTGERTYIPLLRCPHCGQAAPKRVDNGQCTGCRPTPTPKTVSLRQHALAAGLKWWMHPDGTPRRVETSQPGHPRPGTPIFYAEDLLVMDGGPIDEKTAMTLGLKLYHSGREWCYLNGQRVAS